MSHSRLPPRTNYRRGAGHHTRQRLLAARPAGSPLPVAHHRPNAADPVVVRLFADIKMAHAVLRMIEHGSIKRENLRPVQRFERQAWQHLQHYLAAKAFAEL